MSICKCGKGEKLSFFDFVYRLNRYIGEKDLTKEFMVSYDDTKIPIWSGPSNVYTLEGCADCIKTQVLHDLKNTPLNILYDSDTFGYTLEISNIVPHKWIYTKDENGKNILTEFIEDKKCIECKIEIQNSENILRYCTFDKRMKNTSFVCDSCIHHFYTTIQHN